MGERMAADERIAMGERMAAHERAAIGERMAADEKAALDEKISDDWKWCTEYCRNYWPGECAHILRIADDATEQRFVFDLPWDMEQTVKAVEFGGDREGIDWQHMPDGDPEFIYQFNRHRYWICLGQAYAMTGDERYAKCFVSQLVSWVAGNPITEETKQTTWRSIEAGIRGENWVKAMEYFKDSRTVTDGIKAVFRKGLWEHGNYLMNHRTPFSDKSNWGVLESHGLFCIGAALLRESGQAGQSAQEGRSVQPGQPMQTEHPIQPYSPGEAALYVEESLKRLVRQLSIQVMDDGVQWEQSPMYHNEVLRCVLEVLRMARLHGIRVPDILKDKARAMAHADLAWMKPDHTQPCNGDSDRTDLRDVFTPAAFLLKDKHLRYAGYGRLDFESVWELGPEAAMEYESMKSKEPEQLFSVMEHSGNWCLRSGWHGDSDYLHFKCGSLGGGHGHFDKLHIDLSVHGEDVLIDSGRYTYVDGGLRRQLKSSCAHNVPVVDWQEYTQCTGSWDVKGTACATGQQWCRKGEFTFLQGTHLGYLPAGVLVNRRIISIGTRIHVIVDGFYGQGTHVCSQIFHLNPAGTTEIKGNTFLYHGRAAEAVFTVLTPGAALELEDTPVSFHYNQLEEGPCVSISRENRLFTSMVTVITGYGGEDGERCDIRRVPVIAPVTGRQLGDGEAEAVRIREGGHSWLVVINHRETGADSEYIGADGCYGLGRVMACDEAGYGEPAQGTYIPGTPGTSGIPGTSGTPGTAPLMTVLQW